MKLVVDKIGSYICEFPSLRFSSMLISLAGHVDFARDKGYESTEWKALIHHPLRRVCFIHGLSHWQSSAKFRPRLIRWPGPSPAVVPLHQNVGTLIAFVGRVDFDFSRGNEWKDTGRIRSNIICEVSTHLALIFVMCIACCPLYNRD